MLSHKQTEPYFSSEEISEISSNKEKNINNLYNNSISNNTNQNTNYLISDINDIDKCSQTNKNTVTKSNDNYKKRFDSPLILKSKNNIESFDSEKNKLDVNIPKKVKIKKIFNNNLQENLNINKIIEQYLNVIQRLKTSIKNKEEEIKSLKIELENNKQKNINKKSFDILDTGGMGLKILAEKKHMNENTILKPIYKIQFLDKMEILNESINYELKIEIRDSIEILPTLKTPLKGQRTIQMQIDPLKTINYIQILDQMVILNNNNKKDYIEIDERDSIEILPTLKAVLQMQRVSQMYIERLEIPEYLIQNIDNMTIIKEKNKDNKIELRDSIQLLSLETYQLQAQHVQKLVINKIFSDKNIQKLEQSEDIISTPRNKNVSKLTNSIEHIPSKKSPLQLKSAEDLKNKYLKKYKSENKESNNLNKDAEELKIDYIESINICNITSKPKSNYKNYNYGNALIKPTLKMQSIKNSKTVRSNINNHKLEEISYTNKKNKYNFVTPKPSILPVCRTTKNIKIEKNENNKRTTSKNNNNNKDNNNNHNINKIYNNNSSIFKNPKILNKNNVDGCENKRGRNVRVIRTQKHGPSIIEKRFIAHSCEKCNNCLSFKNNNYNSRDNFHAIHSMKNCDSKENKKNNSLRDNFHVIHSIKNSSNHKKN